MNIKIITTILIVLCFFGSVVDAWARLSAAARARYEGAYWGRYYPPSIAEWSVAKSHIKNGYNSNCCTCHKPKSNEQVYREKDLEKMLHGEWK